jgi:CheY-like chemotaxis protein
LELNVFFKENQKKGGKQDIDLKMCDSSESAHVLITTDKVKLKQIFINLIGNAFKYTEQGEIRVNYRFLEDQTIMFSVADTGVGIPLDKQKKVFERFVQLNYGNNRHYGGTGLGLAIVKGLVSLLGGDIWVESEPGVGSTFYFTLPYKTSETTISYQKAPEISDYYDFSGKNILIVEDDLYNSEYLKEVLSNTGAGLLTTTLAANAVSIALSEHIQLILMDINLPDFDGYEAIRQILNVKPEMKIIAQTAYAAAEDRIKALQAGCANYISKPVKRELLLAMVSNCLIEQVGSEVK